MPKNLIDLLPGEKVSVQIAEGKVVECKLVASKSNGTYFKARATDGGDTIMIGCTVEDAKSPVVTDPVDGEVWTVLED